MLFIAFFFTYHFEFLDVLPIGDESYHLGDGLLKEGLSGLNMFSGEWSFLGHPPLYRITLYLWFRVFPATYLSGHQHALFFSFLTIASFYYICFLNINWFSSLVAAIVLMSIPPFYIDIYRCIADIPALFFFIFTMIQIQKGNIKLSSLGLLLLVMIRESGIALPLSMIFIFLIKFHKQPLKDLLIVVLPGMLYLLIFFLSNKFIFGTFSNHPYATGDLKHIDDSISFFSVGPSKWQMFKEIIYRLSINCGKVLELGAWLGFFLLFYEKISKPLKYTSALIFLYGFGYIVFFTFYEDTLDRDLIPTYSAIIFLAFSGLNKLPKKYAILSSLVIGLVTISPNSWISEGREKKKDRDFYVQIAKVIEKDFSEKTICLTYPLNSLREKVYGYFDEKISLKDNCNDPEVLLITSMLSDFEWKKWSKYINKNKLDLKVEKNLSSKWYKIYVKQ
jgi:hypothetical protein